MLHFPTKKNRTSLLHSLNLLKKQAGKPKSLILLTTLFMSLVPSIAQGACLIWTSWEETDLNQQQCLAQAKTALRKSRFTKNFSPLESGVYGENGQYSGTIRCISSKGIAFFIVAGPSANTAQSLLTRLEDNY